MDLIIERLDGTRFRLSEHGVMVLDFVPSPIDITFDSENVQGRPGRIRTRSDYGNRLIKIYLMFVAQNRFGIPILRDEIADLLDGNEPFYVYESVTNKLYDFELPGQTQYNSAYANPETVDLTHKRYLIQRTGNESSKFSGLTGQRIIDFETYELPFAETPFTTLELLNKEWTDDQWAWAMGLTWEEEPPKYTFNTNSFIVKNFGQIKIDPRNIPLVIKLKGTFSSKVTIKNLSTGEEFIYNGPLAVGDELVIDGVDYLKNGARVTGNTNKNLISLKRGENQFEITGGTVTSISFDFRFYFK